jgi:hypothetical protein
MAQSVGPGGQAARKVRVATPPRRRPAGGLAEGQAARAEGGSMATRAVRAAEPRGAHRGDEDRQPAAAARPTPAAPGARLWQPPAQP